MKWSLRSKSAKGIVDHLTPEENEKPMASARIYGAWGAITGGIPIGLLTGLFNDLVLMMGFPNDLTMVIAAILVTAHVVCIPLCFRWQKKFLCSSQWARQHGFRPELLRVFEFRRARLIRSLHSTDAR